MAGRSVFIVPPLNLPEDHIDYPYFTNFSVLAAAARVTRAGWVVDVVDAMALPGSGRFPLSNGGWLLGVKTQSLLDALPSSDPNIVVIGASPFLHPWEPDSDLVMLVEGVRRRYASATIVLADCHVGGMHHVAYDGQEVLRHLPHLDAVLQYAGETYFDDPYRLLRLKHEVVQDPARPWDQAPPFPLYEALDSACFGAFLHRVFSDGTWANPFAVDASTRPFLTSSGCPHRCVFCTSNPGWSRLGKKPYRVIPVPVIEQWAYLVRQITGARRLFILDEMANVRADFEEVLRVFEGLDLDYEFPNGLRADRLTDEAIARMAGRIGLLSVSAESGDEQDLHDRIGKRQSLREVERVLAEARRRNIRTLVHFVVGFPWETPVHVRKTLDLAWRLYEDYGAEPAIQFATPIPGTALYEMCAERGLLPPRGIRWPDATLFQHRPAFHPPALPEGYLANAVQSLRQKVEASRAKKLIVNLTYQCINRCVFCAVSNRVRRHASLPRVLTVLRDHRERGVDLLDLDGGEPTLHPRLLTVVRQARALGYRQVNVTTNGRRLSDRRFARRLLKSGITSLLISLHGSRPEVHEAATRVPGSFRESATGLRHALDVAASGNPRVDIGVNTTVFEGNVDDLLALGEMLTDLGVERWNLQMLTPFGAASARIAPDARVAASAVRDVLDRFADRLRIQVVNAQFCLFPPEYERFLLADTQKLGRTMVFVTEEEVNLFRYIAARRRRIPECEPCPRFPVCDGFYEFGEGEDTDVVSGV